MKVDKIIIDVDEAELEDGKLYLSLKEAEQLKKLLDDLLDKEKSVIYIPQPYPVHHDPWYHDPWWVGPYKITVGDVPEWKPNTTVTWGNPSTRYTTATLTNTDGDVVNYKVPSVPNGTVSVYCSTQK
jgi:hypothetical protein